MKRSILISVAILVASLSYGQGEMDALNSSSTDLTGTARGMGMAGAFGALGGDLTGVAVNPAGIAVYKSSEVLTTMNFSNMATQTKLTGNTLKENKFKFNFDNVAYMGYFPTGNENVPLFNFGFAFNRLKNFERKYQMKGTGMASSLSDYIAEFTNRVGGRNGVYEPNLGLKNGNERAVFDNEPWLSVLGYNSYVIDPLSDNYSYRSFLENGEKIDNSLSVYEKGNMNSYDFSFGTNITGILSLGLTLSIFDIDYRMSSSYTENPENGGTYSLNNWLETDGTGYGLKVGAIFSPVNALRVGLAYHSPTWYVMNDYYQGDIVDNIFDPNTQRPVNSYPNLGSDQAVRNANYTSGETYTPSNATTEYRFHTPYKWVASIAGIIGQSAIISVDYEITDYKSMNLDLPDGSYGDGYALDNSYIDQDFRAASTVKAGLEYKFTPQFAGRVGYAWSQSPLEADFKAGNKEVATTGTITHYILPGDASYFTVGFGYRFTPQFYMDIACVYKTQKADLYPYSSMFIDPDYKNLDVEVISTPASMKNNLFKGLLTVGYKF